ncbi:MAG TPA: hypothetical protein PK152_12565, partial [Anaerolineales bacterium]|nr:hypothetical protein [Anaerolineales bacterium]
ECGINRVFFQVSTSAEAQPKTNDGKVPKAYSIFGADLTSALFCLYRSYVGEISFLKISVLKNTGIIKHYTILPGHE